MNCNLAFHIGKRCWSKSLLQSYSSTHLDFQGGIDTLHRIRCWGMVHSSHHHQSCNRDCWSHHCNTHLQLMDLQHCVHQHQNRDMYIVNIDLLQCTVRSSPHRQSCILGCLFHHYRTHLQSNVHLDKLEFKRNILFICHKVYKSVRLT